MVTGASFQQLSFSFCVGETSVKNVLKESLPIIWNELSKEYVKFPKTRAEWRKIADDFENLGGLPHQIGALDGTNNYFI